jgi:hypothetical protein
MRESTTMILYLAADLIWASKIKSTADALELPARPVRSLEMLEARLADSPVRAAVLDLEADAVWDVLNRLRDPEALPSALLVRILCFGPHVDKAGFDRARLAGAHEVIPRGAFDRGMPDWLIRLNRDNPAAH